MSCRVCGNYRYKVTKDGNARIFLYEGRGNIKLDIGCTLVIPEKLTGYRVTSIAGNAFYGLDFLVNVTLPKSIVFVENSAFRNCSSLKYIELPSTVGRIGLDAFKNTKGLIVNCDKNPAMKRAMRRRWPSKVDGDQTFIRKLKRKIKKFLKK